MELVAELVAGSARSRPLGATALDHESVDDAVERQAVVEPAGRLRTRLGVGVLLTTRCETDEVVHRLRCLIAEQIEHDVAVVGVEGCRLLRHVAAPFS